MAIHTSSLSPMNMSQPAATTENKDNRGMTLRTMLPNLLINAVAPLLINLVAQRYMPTIDALLLASSVPALFTLGNIIWKKHIDALGLLVVVSLLLTAVFALVFKSPRLLLLQGSAVNGLLGVVMLVSLLFPRPVLFYVIRSIKTQNDPKRVASFNADWSFPQFRSFYRVLTAVWGCVTLAQLLLVVTLAFTLPISLMLVLSPFLGFAAIIPAAHWSTIYLRKNLPILKQLREQRDTTTLEAAN